MEAYKRLRPYLTLARSLGLVVAQMGEARISAIGVRYYGELAAEDNQLLGSAVLEGVLSAILVGRRHAGERANDRRRARHRAHRVAQHALAQLHEPHLGETAYGRRRAMGRRHCLRQWQPAPGADRWRRRRVAARRHAPHHQEQRPAWRHRRRRHAARPPQGQHRQLRARSRPGMSSSTAPSAW